MFIEDCNKCQYLKSSVRLNNNTLLKYFFSLFCLFLQILKIHFNMSFSIFMGKITAVETHSGMLYGPRRKKTCLRGGANNTGADQLVHPHSLISTFVIPFFGKYHR